MTLRSDVPLLDVQDLHTVFRTEEGEAAAVDGVSFLLGQGETLGIVGESGCGKSVTSLSIMRLIPSPPGRIASGRVLFEGKDILRLPEDEMRSIRGNEISMIFQEPMTCLNPVFTCGYQVAEAVELHQELPWKEAFARAEGMLRMVSIPLPEKRAREYPHQLSGGMRQRVMIAMALSCRPKILIADEPTTALDVTIQAQILDLMRDLKEEFGTAIILVTHNLGVISEMAERVLVMYAGKVMEEASVEALFDSPKHPYTQGLLGCVPKLHGHGRRLDTIEGVVPGLLRMPSGCRFNPRCPLAADVCYKKEPPMEEVGDGRRVACWLYAGEAAGEARAVSIAWPQGTGHEVTCLSSDDGKKVPLITVRDVRKYFPVERGLFSRVTQYVKAVDGVSFTVHHGETLGIVGESGCGKTTLAKVILRLTEASGGEVFFEGQNVFDLSEKGMRRMRREMQMVFQDPFASLDPRLTVGSIVGEPLEVHRVGAKRERIGRVRHLLDVVGLSPDHANRFAHEFSGGQRQRIGIARALALNPKLVVCDEPVSALDISIQSQILNLLKDLQSEFGLTYFFIAHDLAVVKYVSDRVGVMYLGKIVEMSERRGLYENPMHPYTRALMSAIPVPDPRLERERITLEGDVPSPVNLPSGCRFHGRCPHVKSLCREAEPVLAEALPGHWVACHLANLD